VKNFVIHRLSYENLPLLKKLFKQTFGKSVSLQCLADKYNTKSFGVEYIGFLALTLDNSPAAFYGVIPCHIQFERRRILAAQSADTMTHPNHQRKGLFVLLAQKTYALAKHHNIQFIFGFPNQNSYKGLVKLNWQFRKEPMKLFTFNGSSLPLMRLLYKFSLVRKGVHYVIDSFFFRDKSLSDRMFSDSDCNGIEHDRIFLNYKTYNKTFFVEFEESYAWIKIDGILKVGFVKLQKDRSIEWLIKKIRRFSVLSGCSNFLFLTSQNTSLFEMLKTISQGVDSFPIGFFNLSNAVIDFDKIEFEYCDIDIF
jgi:hypothetical protein